MPAQTMFQPILEQQPSLVSYGSTVGESFDDNTSLDDDLVALERSFRKSEIFPAVVGKVASENLFVSDDQAATKYELELVPPEQLSSFQLVCKDTADYYPEGNHSENDQDGCGYLYVSAASYCNKKVALDYALTMTSDIYKNMLSEASDSQGVPCGLYFCCHGGDGAHTGHDDDDHVDIALAKVLVMAVFGFMLYLSFGVE